MCSRNSRLVVILLTFTLGCCEAFFITTLCNGKGFDPDIHTCCNDKLFPRQKYIDCCGGEFYDTRAQSCILGVALINDDTGCDGTYYNTMNEFCCNKKIYAKLPTQRCCGDTVLYDPTEHDCTFFDNLEKKM